MKVAIVTGAGSGLGRAIAIKFAQQGWCVVCCDVQDKIPAGETQSTVAAINTLGNGQAIFVKADVSVTEQVQTLITKTVEQFGRLDVMVNNAGISLESHNALGPKLTAETDDNTFDQTFAVNQRGVFLGSKYAIRQFLAQEPRNGHRGWIINTASVYGLRAEIGHISYCATKAAVIHMTKCLAREYGSRKIHVNCICPGFVATAMDSNMLSDREQHAQVAALHALGELGTTNDIAEAALFLASDQAAWVTGVAMPIDGGYMVGH